MTNDTESNWIREIPQTMCKFNESDYVWNESAHGSKLIIEDNGKIIRALDTCKTHQGARAKMLLDSNGIFEWNVIIKKGCINT